MESLANAAVPLIAAVVASVIWLVAGIAVVVRPAKSLAARDAIFLGLTVLTAATWAWGFLPRLAHAKPAEARVAAATVSGAGACVSVRIGMRSAEVVKLLGQPNVTAAEDDIWGPGAIRWSYSDSRCRVHLLDDTVHMVD